METIKEILNSQRKPKEKVSLSADQIKKDGSLFKELMEILETGSNVEKGHCADIMKHVTMVKPEIAEPYIYEIIKFINHKVPRVKWGVPESIGNIAKKNYHIAEKAIPYLIKNTVDSKENSTVIRWCSACALSEIAKASKSKELIKKIDEIVKEEKNNGVKNVYLKAIKDIGKSIV